MQLRASWRAALQWAICVAFACCAETATAQQFQLTEAQFDAWISNGRGEPVDLVESQLTAQLDRLDDACNLSDDQRQKLLLAGRGDIERFLADIAAVRAKLVGKAYGQQEINQVYGEIRPLAQRLEQGVLGSGSLFQKVKTSVLDDEQRAAYLHSVGQRNAFHYRAKLKLFVAALDQVAPMRNEQREQLLELLNGSTRPPNRQAGSQIDWFYVVVQASEAPADKLAEILDDAQLRCFQGAVQQAPQFREMLKSQNVVPFDEADDSVVAAPPPVAPIAAPAPMIFQFQVQVQ
jgi:hypothetical protein